MIGKRELKAYRSELVSAIETKTRELQAVEVLLGGGSAKITKEDNIGDLSGLSITPALVQIKDLLPTEFSPTDAAKVLLNNGFKSHLSLEKLRNAVCVSLSRRKKTRKIYTRVNPNEYPSAYKKKYVRDGATQVKNVGIEGNLKPKSVPQAL